MNVYRMMYHPNKPEGIEEKKAFIVGGVSPVFPRLCS